jgi:hypothetical protein
MPYNCWRTNMKSGTLKQGIRRASLTFAHKRNLPIDDSHSSAVIFRNLSDSFHPESFTSINNQPNWRARITKAHHVQGTKEMQSSNSSDALLMNIFCHPGAQRWKGLKNLIEDPLKPINFGFRCHVRINGGKNDSTEIDMEIPGIFCEAKLTETDFTQKPAKIVENYDNLQRVFHVGALPRLGNNYDNYQVIRNLLASIEHNRKHILFCDERRPDLVRRYMTTVLCLRNVEHRNKCRVIFWQELISACGSSLRDWIEEKYGMSL